MSHWMDERLQQQLLLTWQKQTFTLSLTRPALCSRIHSILSHLFKILYFKFPPKITVIYQCELERKDSRTKKGKNERERWKGKNAHIKGAKNVAHSSKCGLILFLCNESLCTCYRQQCWVKLPVQLSVISHIFIRGNKMRHQGLNHSLNFTPMCPECRKKLLCMNQTH